MPTVRDAADPQRLARRREQETPRGRPLAVLILERDEPIGDLPEEVVFKPLLGLLAGEESAKAGHDPVEAARRAPRQRLDGGEGGGWSLEHARLREIGVRHGHGNIHPPPGLGGGRCRFLVPAGGDLLRPIAAALPWLRELLVERGIDGDERFERFLRGHARAGRLHVEQRRHRVGGGERRGREAALLEARVAGRECESRRAPFVVDRPGHPLGGRPDRGLGLDRCVDLLPLDREPLGLLRQQAGLLRHGDREGGGLGRFDVGEHPLVGVVGQTGQHDHVLERVGGLDRKHSRAGAKRVAVDPLVRAGKLLHLLAHGDELLLFRRRRGRQFFRELDVEFLPHRLTERHQLPEIAVIDADRAPQAVEFALLADLPVDQFCKQPPGELLVLRIRPERGKAGRHPGDVERVVGQAQVLAGMLGEGGGMLHRGRMLAEAGLREHIERHAVESGQVQPPGSGAARTVFRRLYLFAAVLVGHEMLDHLRADLLALHDDAILDLLEPSRRLAALNHRHDFFDLGIFVLVDRFLPLYSLGRHLHPLDQLHRLGRREGEAVIVSVSRHPRHERGDAVGHRLPHRRREQIGLDQVRRGGGQQFGLLLLRLAEGGRSNKTHGRDQRDRDVAARSRRWSNHARVSPWSKRNVRSGTTCSLYVNAW